MNKLLLFKLSIILGLFVFLSSCETEATNSSDGEQSETEAKGKFKDCFKTSDCLTLTGDPKSKEDYIISKECYECLTGNYKSNGSKFSKYLDPISKDGPGIVTVDAPRGFHVPHGELREMLDNIQSPETAEIYIMLGLETEADKVPHAIFLVKDRVVGDSLAEGTAARGREIVLPYDFTTPCPNYCPDL